MGGLVVLWWWIGWVDWVGRDACGLQGLQARMPTHRKAPQGTHDASMCGWVGGWRGVLAYIDGVLTVIELELLGGVDELHARRVHHGREAEEGEGGDEETHGCVVVFGVWWVGLCVGVWVWVWVGGCGEGWVPVRGGLGKERGRKGKFARRIQAMCVVAGCVWGGGKGGRGGGKTPQLKQTKTRMKMNEERMNIQKNGRVVVAEGSNCSVAHPPRLWRRDLARNTEEERMGHRLFKCDV